MNSLLKGVRELRLSLGSRGAFSTANIKWKERTGISQLLLDRYEEPSNIPRWCMVVPAFSVHLCLGASYGWSAIAGQLTRECGVVSTTLSDWSLAATSLPMAVMIGSGGISAALLGSWSQRVGLTRAVATGGIMYGCGLSLSSLGVFQHNLPLLYAGNILCGVGYGCAYTSPLQAVMDWFPDRRGLVSGLVIAGFGSGALLFTPMMGFLTDRLKRIPEYLGTQVEFVSEGGRLFLDDGTMLQEIVYSGKAELALLPYSGLSEGFYLVNSGSTGVAPSLAIMAALYSTIIISSSLLIKKPWKGYTVETGINKTAGSVSKLNMPPEHLLKTPQFYLLFTSATLLATGGMAVMSVAHPMVQDIFAPVLPELVTPQLASAYVMSLAVANLGGRVAWAAISDRIGCRRTFNILTASSVGLFSAVPWLVTSCIAHGGTPLAPLYYGGFCLTTFLAISIMGGVFSVLPPYEAELYGSKYVGAIHSKFLPFSTVRGIGGPWIILSLRNLEERRAVLDLLDRVDPTKLATVHGLQLQDIQSMVDQGAMTVTKLMSVTVPGTVDPSPFLYNSTMYTMAVIAMVAGSAHILIKPVNRKYFEKSGE